MIARIIFLLLPMIILSDLYIDCHYLRHRPQITRFKRIIWWLPAAVMIAFTLALTFCGKFIPDNINWIKTYLILLSVLVVPKTIYALISSFGLFCRRFWHIKQHYFDFIGLLLGIICMLTMLYGIIFGTRELRVTHIELSFKDLPKAFEGTRIVLFSDAHIGSFNHGMERYLKRDVDTILALRPDIICFVGDLQNTQPSELLPQKALLSKLAHHGIPMYSVLGNHDYSKYFYGDSVAKKACEAGIKQVERDMGWHLLLNEHTIYYSKDRRDSLVIAGEENCGDGKYFPDNSNIEKTLKGVNRNAFIILLQHDPKTWESRILPKSHAQLTLCGHTHGGQISIFGLRPTMFAYPDDYGLAERPADSYMLHVALEVLHRYVLALNPRLPSSLYTPNTNSTHHHEVSLPTLSAFLLLAHTALCQYHHIVSDRCWLSSWQRTLLGLLSRQVLVMALDTSFALTSKGGRS